MSKVRSFEGIDSHTKTKMRKRLRRKESAKIKNDRIHNRQNTKWFPKTEVNINRIEEVVIPEHTRDALTSEIVHKLYRDENGIYYPAYTTIWRTKQVVVPERRYKRHIHVETKEVGPYLKMKGKNDLKYYKNIGNRKVRHYKGDLQKSDYKKLYDIWWIYY